MFNSKITRIAFALSMWTATVLLALKAAGLFQDDGQQIVQMRQDLCEVVAVNCSQYATKNDLDSIELTLTTLVKRHADVESAACQRADETLVVVGPHSELWLSDDENQATNNCIYVPVMEGSKPWGQVEVSFRPIFSKGFRGLLSLPSVRVTCAATLLNFLGFWFWIRKCIRPMNAAAIVPQRVRNTLDTMAEAVVVLDAKHKIVTANTAFASLLNRPVESLAGDKIESLPWVGNEFVLERLTQHSGTAVRLEFDNKRHSFLARTSKVSDDNGVHYGHLLSLANVTALENARANIEEKNKELEYLATRDPLTSCLNRRSFFDIFRHQWDHAVELDIPIGCVMVDIDHFKSINDNHGHAMGDEVLRQVSATLRDSVRERDYVCRYGGEEFCILLPGSTLAQIEQAAERYRKNIEALEIGELRVTASLGCSERGLGADQLEAMIEQADLSLYASKENGRNQVTRFEGLPANKEPQQHAQKVAVTDG